MLVKLTYERVSGPHDSQYAYVRKVITTGSTITCSMPVVERIHNNRRVKIGARRECQLR
jgi:hypothetical protein